MIYTRTPINTALPITLADVKDHLRVTDNRENTLINRMIATAALEFEDLCGIALLSQTITATSAIDPGKDLDLPVGPVASGATLTVEALAEDGTTAPITGYWLEAGRYAVLHLDDTPDHRVRVTYPASMAASAAAVPADIQLAIADQVARLYDQRGGVFDRGPALSAHSARVIARYRRARL
jgi:uncharacterized phiE125 gp8 family phage protein